MPENAPFTTSPYRECRCGCGQSTKLAPCSDKNKKWVRGQPLQFIHGHNTRKTAIAKFSGFLCKVRIIPLQGRPDCMEWMGRLADGYGVSNNKLFGEYMAHRISYVFCFGPISDGLQLDHLCKNRACVNPDHLEAVTPKINARRSSRTKLTSDLVRMIRTSSESTRRLARNLGVCRSTIKHVRQLKVWI